MIKKNVSDCSDVTNIEKKDLKLTENMSDCRNFGRPIHGFYQDVHHIVLSVLGI